MLNAWPCLEGIRSFKITYAMSKNKKLLESICEDIAAFNRPSSGYLEYQRKGAREMEKFGKWEGKAFVFKDDEAEAEWVKIQNGLQAQYDKAIDQRNKQLDEYRNILEQEAEENPIFHKIKLEKLDESIKDELTQAQMDLLINFEAE